MRRLALLLAAIAAPAAAASLSATKTATVVSDPVDTINPKALPGAVVDYRVVFTNPLANSLVPVKALVVTDTLPANVVMRVTDLGSAGSGPVEFTDGGILGLLGSGLTCAYVSLGSQIDCVDFSRDGTNWGYVPVPDANGYDANVRAIKVTPVTSFTAGGSFQLRYRVRIK